jgi:hypothetical protein
MSGFKQKKIALFQLFLYLLLFTCFYLPFIKENLLPGKIDTWFNLGIFKHYSNLIDHFLFNASVLLPNYPEGKVFLYGESSLLTGLFFYISDKLFSSDLTAYIAVYIGIQTLNSFSFALFLKQFLKTNRVVAFIGGLFFSFSAFNLAFYDNVVYAIWFPLFFSLYFLVKAMLSHKNSGYLILAALCFYLQMYFSIYNFLMGAILEATLILLFYSLNFKKLAQLSFFYLLLIPITIPFIYLYLVNSHIDSSFNDYITIEIIDGLGFQAKDLYRSFQSNVLYGSFSEYKNTVNDYWYLGNLGVGLFILSSIGFLASSTKLKLWSIFLLVTGLLFAFGPYWGNYKSPSFLLYQVVPVFKQFKLIFKFYYLVQIGFLLLSVQGLHYLSRIFPTKKALLYSSVLLLFCIENLPTNRLEYSIPFEQAEVEAEDLRKLQDARFCTLFLPMCAPMFPEENNKECFVEGRAIEFKYLYWQAFLEINMLNGSNGTIPKNRVEMNEIFDSYGNIEAIQKLHTSHQLKYIYYDKKVGYTFKNPSLQSLKSELSNYKENENYAIFTIE